MARPELAEYSIHDLLQEAASRPEFWGVLIYANRPPFDREPAMDDKLLIQSNQALSPQSSIRLLARAIEIFAAEPPAAE